MNSSLEVRAIIVLNQSQPTKPYEKRTAEGKLSYASRTLEGDGVLYVGPAAQDDKLEGSAVEGVDRMLVRDFSAMRFSQGDKDELLDRMATLRRGDEVEVWLSLQYELVKFGEKSRTAPRFGPITAVRVLARAAAVEQVQARRPVFSEAK